MNRLCRISCIFSLCLTLTLSTITGSVIAAEETPQKEVSAEMMTIDLLLVRPLGIVATVLGGGVFIVSLPFTALGGNVEGAYNALLSDPAKFTFVRPLGDFGDE